jgi:hypothetical protein
MMLDYAQDIENILFLTNFASFFYKFEEAICVPIIGKFKVIPIRVIAEPQMLAAIECNNTVLFCQPSCAADRAADFLAAICVDMLLALDSISNFHVVMMHFLIYKLNTAKG